MYKKVLVVTSTHYCIPLIAFLKQEGLLNGVIVPEQYAIIKDMLVQVVGEENVQIIPDADQPTPSDDCDLMILLAYPYKVDLIENLNMINIHFGPLPENRGPDPVFWTIKNGKNLAYLSIHEVSNDYDAGDLLLEKGIDLIPGENYGMLWARLAQQIPNYVAEIVAGKYQTKPQDESKAVYNPQPEEKDYTIDWNNMTSRQIQRMVQATNPKYGGAITTFQHAPMRLLDVNPAQVEPEPGKTYAPGTIVHCSPENGIYVSCINDQYLRLNIISMTEGVFTDNRLAAMGNSAGLILGS